MLSIWRGNIDCQPILSIDAVIKYIEKYVAKEEQKSETYRAMLSRISSSLNGTMPAPTAL